MPESSRSMFRTHYNYAKSMARTLDQIQIHTTLRTTTQLDQNKIRQFWKLAKITHRGITSELDACSEESVYSQVVAPWMPVKCYYRIYYLESIMIYLLNGNVAGFSNGGHTRVRSAIKSLIENGQISFSNPKVAQAVTMTSAKTHTISSGANLSPTYFQTDDCILSIRKKVADYVEHNWKTVNQINYRLASHRSRRYAFFDLTEVNLTDYFYWMRIKANYRDVDFLDFEQDVTEQDAYNYILQYAVAHESYANALETFINELLLARGMTPLPLA
jgi:hypothetical protein